MITVTCSVGKIRMNFVWFTPSVRSLSEVGKKKHCIFAKVMDFFSFQFFFFFSCTATSRTVIQKTCQHGLCFKAGRSVLLTCINSAHHILWQVALLWSLNVCEAQFGSTWSKGCHYGWGLCRWALTTDLCIHFIPKLFTLYVFRHHAPSKLSVWQCYATWRLQIEMIWSQNVGYKSCWSSDGGCFLFCETE